MGVSSKAQDMQLPPAEAALACLLGIAPDGCQNIFVDAGAAARSVIYCAQQYHHRIWLSNGPFREPCPDGPLEKVDYLGTNAAGADVYEVQYMHANMTYVIAQPGPDGKISQFWTKRGNPNSIIPSSLAEVPSSSAHRMSVYRRPAEWRDPADRQDANASPATSDNKPLAPASAGAHYLSAGAVQAVLGTPPAPPPRLDPNEPYKITTCNVPNGARMCDLVTLASASASASVGPDRDLRNRTELAMKCWLGLVAYNGCWQSLCGNGDAGPLERVEYLGRTAVGADIYRVRYRYRGAAAYEISPDPQGTANQYLVRATDPYWIKREISSRAAPILIYARPEDAPPAGCSRGGDSGDPGGGAVTVGPQPQPQQGGAITP
jgi:hypothetical protein